MTVNGEPGQLNTFVGADDDVRLDGKPLAKQRVAYVLLNKPAGVVTTARDPQGRRTVVDSSRTRRASCRSVGSTSTRRVRSC